MVVLAMPCSVIPHLHHNLLCKASPIATNRSITNISTVATSATITTYQPKSLFQILNNPLQIDRFQELSKTLIKDPEEKDQSYGGILEKEVASVIQRLVAFGERVRESEKKKFMNKIKGSELSQEESMLVEDLSREIVNEFLAKPIQFLTSSGGDLEDKLKEIKFLVDILEESCP